MYVVNTISVILASDLREFFFQSLGSLFFGDLLCIDLLCECLTLGIVGFLPFIESAIEESCIVLREMRGILWCFFIAQSHNSNIFRFIDSTLCSSGFSASLNIQLRYLSFFKLMQGLFIKDKIRLFAESLSLI